MEFENISRRSFLKKTTVLTVGVASMTLFSGLVNAETGSGSGAICQINTAYNPNLECEPYNSLFSKCDDVFCEGSKRFGVLCYLDKDGKMTGLASCPPAPN